MPEPIPEEAAGGTRARPTQVTHKLLRAWPLPSPTGTKYARGQALVVGGARNTPGAAMLAGVAALRMGAGRLSLAVAAPVAAHVAVAIPESGVLPLAADEAGSVTGLGAGELLAKECSRADAVLVGPGLDEPQGALRLLGELVEVLPEGIPVVLDAYGATVLPDADASVREALAGRLVLTPNTGELARLLGREELEEGQVAQAVLSCAKAYGAAVGCNAFIAHEGALWEVTAGDTGLGTSGSGDVMAGAVTGLLSRGAGLAQALAWGKYVHATAGDNLATRYGRIGFLAGELGPELPRVMRTLGGD